MNRNFSLWQGETCTLVKLFLIKEKIPNNHFTFLARCVKCTQNQFILLILHWAEFGSFFLGKTHLYWLGDYLLLLLTVYKYSINLWSVGQQLGNNFNKKNIKKVLLLDILSFSGERRGYQEAKLKNTIKQSEVPDYMFIL